MKILTDKKVSAIKNEVITKMYNAILAYHDLRESKTAGADGSIPCAKDDEVMNIVLKYFYAKPTGERKYDWSRSADLSNLLK